MFYSTLKVQEFIVPRISSGVDSDTLLLLATLTITSSSTKTKLFWYYRVSQQVWNNVLGLRNDMSEVSIVFESYEKIVFCSIKLLFQPYFLNCKIQNDFLKQLFSIFLCSELFSKMEKSCFKKPFSFLQFRKKAQKVIFWSEKHFLYEKPIIYFYWEKVFSSKNIKC